jgi:hypothetical protein
MPNSAANVTFSTFITSLYASTVHYIGDGSIKTSPKELEMARQTIDLIVILEEKTKGNLDKEEERLVAQLCHDLRVRYVKARDAS